MSDEQSTPVADAGKPADLPPEITVDEKSCYKITAVQATLGKLMAEAELIRRDVVDRQNMFRQHQASIQKLQQHFREVREEVAKSLDIASLDMYDVDLESGKGTLRKQAPAPTPGA